MCVFGMVKVMFFDFDGTILDTRAIAVRAFKKTFGKSGIEYDDGVFKKLGTKSSSMKADDIFRAMGVLDSEIGGVVDLFFEYFVSELLESDLDSCGDLSVLRALKERCELIVVSNNRKDFLDLALKKMGIEDLFSEVHGEESEKEKDGVLLEILERRGFRKKDCLYVGDMFSDVRFAKKVGMRVVAIFSSCSWSSREELELESPDFLIERFEELLPIAQNT